MFKLPVLPYLYDALEPVIDARTLEIHHGKHHQAYVDNLNTTLKDEPILYDVSVEELLKNISTLPESVRTGVRNFGGGHANHAFFWLCMTSKKMNPSSTVVQLLERDFGTVDLFKEAFTRAAQTCFGSGWAWLVMDSTKNLQVLTTSNQDSPLSKGLIPLLCIDVWEHAYYLKYQNRRAEFITAWWQVVNWDFIQERISVL